MYEFLKTAGNKTPTVFFYHYSAIKKNKKTFVSCAFNAVRHYRFGKTGNVTSKPHAIKYAYIIKIELFSEFQ